MEPIISNVTTVLQIESVHAGYKFAGSVTIYNNLKAVKEINCRVTKQGISETVPPTTVPENRYVVTRGLSSSQAGGYLQNNTESEAMLAAGIEFEAMLAVKIADMTLSETI